MIKVCLSLALIKKIGYRRSLSEMIVTKKKKKMVVRTTASN